MKELCMGVVCGLVIGGLVGWAITGCITGGLALVAVGFIIAGCELAAEKKAAEEEENSWRREYPSYKY